MRLIGAVLVLLVTIATAGAEDLRSHAVLSEFQRRNPCPATGLPDGRCPGYVKDHIKALCAGGADAAENLQWQTTEDGAAKDKLEAAECRALHRGAGGQ